VKYLWYSWNQLFGLVICEIVRVKNIICRNPITWYMGKHMEIVMLEFKDWCGLSDEHGVI
jgi:hypothetical protein